METKDRERSDIEAELKLTAERIRESTERDLSTAADERRIQWGILRDDESTERAVEVPAGHQAGG